MQAEAVRYLAWNMAATPPLLAAMILGGAFTGAGATIYQAVIFGSAAWLVRLPLAYLLGHVVLQSANGLDGHVRVRAGAMRQRPVYLPLQGLVQIHPAQRQENSLNPCPATISAPW